MKIDAQTVTAPEAAYILQNKLGGLRAWADFLADNIRGRQSINGLTLMPCARRKDSKAWRPVYDVRDVLKFVADVKAIEPSASEGKPIKPVTLTIEDGRFWKLNKFNEDGSTAYRRIDYGRGNPQAVGHTFH